LPAGMKIAAFHPNQRRCRQLLIKLLRIIIEGSFFLPRVLGPPTKDTRDRKGAFALIQSILRRLREGWDGFDLLSVSKTLGEWQPTKTASTQSLDNGRAGLRFSPAFFCWL
jgi:hypothetical protein